MADRIWLGWTKYESGAEGYLSANSDRGRAYGRYQFDYRYALADFFRYCVRKNAQHYSALQPFIDCGKGSGALRGSSILADLWLSFCKEYPEEFYALQDAFAFEEYYLPCKRYMKEKLGIDLDRHSAALRGSAFSMAVRSGQEAGAMKYSDSRDTDDDAGIMRRAYARYAEDDAGRWPEQLADALAYLEKEEAVLRIGSTGGAVKTMQAMLAACGYTGITEEAKAADGEFGPVTLHNLKDGFQAAHADALDVDGEYGPESRALLEKEYATRLDGIPDALGLPGIAAAADRFAGMVTGVDSYGDAPFLPAVNNLARVVSCDRFVASILYNLGYRDIGNVNVEGLAAYLDSRGIEKNESYDAILPGDVIFYPGHVFLVAGKEGSLWKRYDGGSDERLRQAQPFTEAIEEEEFVCSYHLVKEQPEIKETGSDSKNSSGAEEISVADAKAKIEKAIAWAVGIAGDETHGYDQEKRWGPDYDCSSLVISAFEQAGVPVKTNGATYTGDMLEVFTENGFSDVIASVNAGTGAGLVRGDVLLVTRDSAHHTAIYLGGGRIVHASINEFGTVTGGRTGDQANEIVVRSYYDKGWNHVLRLGGDAGSIFVKEAQAWLNRYLGISLDTDGEAGPLTRAAGVKAAQTFLDRAFSAGLDVDGEYGSLTRRALVLAYQKALNSVYSAGIDEDGEFGPQTRAAVRILRAGSIGLAVSILQAALLAHGICMSGIDAEYGSGTEAGVRAAQEKYGMEADGEAGPETIGKLLA